MKELSGERLVLRKLCESDHSAVSDMLSDELVMRFIGPRRALSAHEISSWLTETIADYDNDWNRWDIALKASDEFVGMVGIRKEAEEYDFGYYLRQKFWGKGLAAEAVKMALQEIRTHNVAFHIFIAEENLHSKNVLTQLGIQHGKNVVRNGETGVLYSHIPNHHQA